MLVPSDHVRSGLQPAFIASFKISFGILITYAVPYASANTTPLLECTKEGVP